MKKFIKKIPNILTVIRFILIPIIVISLALNNYAMTLAMFIVSSLTDVLDGIIARKFDAITDFGKLMDPLADKLTQLSIILTLVSKGIIPVWIIIILFLKEIILIIGASFLYGKELVVSSRWYGKLTTVLIFAAVVSSLLIGMLDLPKFDIYLYYLSVVFAIFSLISYIYYFYGKGYLPKKEDIKKTMNTKGDEKNEQNS